MHSLEEMVAANDAAVMREFDEAVKNRNTELALRILRANPDVFALTPKE